MTVIAARTDVHQHLWSESLVAALAARSSPPRAGRIRGGYELVLSAEPSSPLAVDDPARRAALLVSDGIDRAVLALSPAIGAMASAAGREQLVYGSDRPVVPPSTSPDDDLAAAAPSRLLGC